MPTPIRGRTDTPLTMPSFARASVFLGRLIRLRCPHCGSGGVLKWDGGVRDRCSSCNLRFKRGDANYFFGAMFFGVLLGELLFAISFGVIVVSTWPKVPWGLLQWILPAGILVMAPIFIPFSKLAYLSVDVMVRPVTSDEMIG